jgi:NADH-quinone oxidoreductase subunit A
MLSEYVGVLLMLGIVVSLALGVLAIQLLRGRRRPPSPEPEPSLDSEPPSASVRPSEAIGFHLLALLVVVFDAAAVFFYPWGATFSETGTAGAMAIAVFALPLAVAWLYAWRKGALEW